MANENTNYEMEKTMKTTTISHADYSNMQSFARVAKIFSGAAVLPHSEVRRACVRAGGIRSQPVEVSMLHDGELRSGYRVGGEFGELILIDAAYGAYEVWDLSASDADATIRKLATYPYR